MSLKNAVWGILPILLILSGCAAMPAQPATKAPLTLTATTTAAPPTSTSIPATPTRALPQVVVHVLQDNVPGISYDRSKNEMTVQVSGEALTVSPDQVIYNSSEGVYEVTSGRDWVLAVFDPSIKSQRWGAGKEWVSRNDAVILDTSYQPKSPDDTSVYAPNHYIQVAGEDELREALRLGYLFRPPSFPPGVQGIDPKMTVPNYNKLDIGSLYANPIGYRDNYHMPTMYYNNIMLKSDTFSSVVLQEAVLNSDSTIGVLSFSLSDKTPEKASSWMIGSRYGGDGSEAGNYLLPAANSEPQSPSGFDALSFDMNKSVGLILRSNRFDLAVEQAIETWLNTGILPRDLKGIPIEEVLFFPESWTMFQWQK